MTNKTNNTNFDQYFQKGAGNIHDWHTNKKIKTYSKYAQILFKAENENMNGLILRKT